MNQKQRDELLLNMYNQMQKMNEDIQQMKGNINNLNKRVSNIEENITQLSEKVSNIEENVTQLNERVSNIEEELLFQGNVLTKIETFHEEKITTLFDAHYVNKEKIEVNENKIVELEKKNDSQDVEIFKLQSKISS